MDVVEQFLDARRNGRSEEAIELIAPNASVSFPWGGLRSGDAVKHYIRNEPTFARKEYLSASVEIKEVAPNTFQRHYRWDRDQNEAGSGYLAFLNKLRGNQYLPTFREVYFVNNGKISHVATNKDPTNKTFLNFFTYYCNPWAAKPIILFQDAK